MSNFCDTVDQGNTTLRAHFHAIASPHKRHDAVAAQDYQGADL
jgi:hypothetical protein